MARMARCVRSTHACAACASAAAGAHSAPRRWRRPVRAHPRHLSSLPPPPRAPACAADAHVSARHHRYRKHCQARSHQSSAKLQKAVEGTRGADSRVAHARKVPKLVRLDLDLVGKLARRRKHEHRWPVARVLPLLTNVHEARQQEAQSFARACLGDGDHIAPLHGYRPRLRLDRCGLCEASLADLRRRVNTLINWTCMCRCAVKVQACDIANGAADHLAAPQSNLALPACLQGQLKAADDAKVMLQSAA